MGDAIVEVVDCSQTAAATAPKVPSSIASERIRDFLKSHLTTDSNADATSDDENQRDAAGSPPPNCAICLGRVTSKCFTDSCMHQFCFGCLLEWSKVKAECPLCKQPFKSIIHNVVSMDKYEEYKVEQRRFANNFRNIADSLELILFEHDFLTRNRQREISLGRLVHPNFITQVQSSRHVLPTSTSANPSASNFNRFYQLFLNETPLTERFARQYASDTIPSRSSGTIWRAYVYQRHLYAMPLADLTGRSRDISARFYAENPAQVHRLMPWLNREVMWMINSLMPISYTMGMMAEFITTYDITSRAFHNQIAPYFHNYTTHFIHELANFARSQFDMIGYDLNVEYQPYFEELVENMLVESDEEIIGPENDTRPNFFASAASTISSTSVTIQSTPSTSTISMTGGLAPLIFRPTAQLAPVNLTSVTIDSESSDDDVVFVREQKPPHLRTPVMVELNSDSDSDVQFVNEELPIKLEGDPECVHPITNAQGMEGYSSAEELNMLSIKPTIFSRQRRGGPRPSATQTRAQASASTSIISTDDETVIAVAGSSSTPSSPFVIYSPVVDIEETTASNDVALSVKAESPNATLSSPSSKLSRPVASVGSEPDDSDSSASSSHSELFAANNLGQKWNQSPSSSSSSGSSTTTNSPKKMSPAKSDNTELDESSGEEYTVTPRKKAPLQPKRKRKLSKQKRGTTTATKRRQSGDAGTSRLQTKRLRVELKASEDSSTDSSD